MKKYIILFLSIFLFSGCEKFLDVAPDDRVYEDEVFLDQDGFAKSLSGIYKYMASAELYQNKMKFGGLDLITQYFLVSTEGEVERDLMAFDYENLGSRQVFDQMWGGLYNAIHQTNIIIKNLPNIEGNKNYQIIAGEAFGLRAFLHLEVLKTFGPIIQKEGLDKAAIPYYETADKTPQKYLSSKQVLDKIEKDLQTAVGFLKEDPIIENGRELDGNNQNGGVYSSLFDRRGIRMNYYAAKALLARKSIWEGDLPKAYDRAMEVINELKETEAIRFVKNSDVSQQMGKDLRFSIENIFAIYDRTSKNVFDYYFLTSRFKISYQNNLQNLFEKGTGDWGDIRFNWGFGDYYFKYFSKFSVTSADLESVNYNPKAFEIQLINLPEMYFIAAEAKIDTDPAEALRLMNEFRKNRQMRSELKLEGLDLNQLLVDEVRREYIGEGFLFSFLKRKFLPITSSVGETPASLEIYKLPIPLNENLYNR
ncbi:RagB/SusD family nutrient uptake outer membrane protein [Sphingobacterium daejeonense]|uniref:RagB/SusD family nutrient uptake outer membrane protein n=1 Tax=Sphingobacterium daejeonense TaxID=371142 RepID=UPI0021A93A1E|nr:RagB/SusD family nutrient uptake outer membrane protein [Sphingobacterium daejeonense]MCT1532281.1 RagB/SusD family nutrient uptake outer membrane protein [Sphingobacterium daejeonense]